MIQLSYSTINSCLQPENSHNWINRQLGRTIPENEAMSKGKELQDYIKSHQSEFPQLKDFILGNSNLDPNMKIEVSFSDSYKVIGYLDGKSKDAFLEIKTSTKFWSLGQFYKSPQIRMYADMLDILDSKITKVVCMTALSDISLWKMQPPKFFEFDITIDMKVSGHEYVQNAIELYEKGVFEGGLDESGKCNIYCNFGENCYYR